MNQALTMMILAIAMSFALGQSQSRSLILNTPVAADSKSTEETQAEQALRQIENEILTALLKSDTSALNRLWADEYSFTAPDGRVVTKENYIALIESGSLKYEVIKLEDLKVRVYGDTALAAGRITVKGIVGTHIIDGQDRYLTVYVKRQGRWQQVATHSSRIARQAAQ